MALNRGDAVNRRAVVPALVLLGCAALVMMRWVRPERVADPPTAGRRAAEVDSRIDPNTADAAALSAIPMLGEKRAADVVAFREQFVRTRPGEVPFRSTRDLMKVKGIGAALAATMGPYLKFPPSNP